MIIAARKAAEKAELARAFSDIFRAPNMRKKPHKDTEVSAVGRDSECLERAENVEDAAAPAASFNVIFKWR